MGGFFAGFDTACPEPVCDWARHYVPASRALFETGLPTWGYVYPPTLALLVWPLAWSSWGTLAWGLLLLLVQAVLAVLPPHLVPDTPARVAVGFSAITALTVPVLQVLDWGQVSALLVLLGLLAFRVSERASKNSLGIPGLGGALVGFAAAVKVYPLLLLPWFLVRRRFVEVGAAFASALLLGVILPLVALGPATTWAFYEGAAGELVRLMPDMQKSIGPQSLVSVAERLFLAGNTSLRPILGGAAVLLGLGQLALLFLIPKRRPSDGWMWAFVLAYGSFPLFVTSSWLHYFAHLPIAWLLLARVLLRERPTYRLGVSVALLTSVALGTWPCWVALGNDWYPALGAVLGSHVLTVVGMVLVLVDAHKGEVIEGSSRGVDTPSGSR